MELVGKKGLGEERGNRSEQWVQQTTRETQGWFQKGQSQIVRFDDLASSPFWVFPLSIPDLEILTIGSDNKRNL